MQEPVIVVSGLPRSGTSVMMQMLARGGVEIVTDSIRAADTDNPRGYYEFERVKKIKEDKAWLPGARGKAVKMVSQLLYELPATEQYRIIFMERDLDEVLASQEKMLERLGKVAAPREPMERAFRIHLERVDAWLKSQHNSAVLRVNYKDLVEKPEAIARRVCEFLGILTHAQDMADAVDPALYRNKKNRSAQPSGAAAREPV